MDQNSDIPCNRAALLLLGTHACGNLADPCGPGVHQVIFRQSVRQIQYIWRLLVEHLRRLSYCMQGCRNLRYRCAVYLGQVRKIHVHLCEDPAHSRALPTIKSWPSILVSAVTVGSSKLTHGRATCHCHSDQNDMRLLRVTRGSHMSFSEISAARRSPRCMWQDTRLQPFGTCAHLSLSP